MDIASPQVVSPAQANGDLAGRKYPRRKHKANVTLKRLVASTVIISALTALAYHFSSPSQHQALVDFWFHDFHPFFGLMRIVFYTGMLITCLLSPISRPHLGDSPIQAPEIYAYTLPEFFSLEGCMKLIAHPFWLSRLPLIRNVTVAAWICCILGFLGTPARMVVAFGTLLLHGVCAGSIGTSHRWYVPVYVLLALCFCDGNVEWSLDAYFTRLFPNAYPFPPSPPTSILATGYGRKISLISAIATLFFGGITKLLNSGLAWMDGRSLAYYVSSNENGKSEWLKNFMHRHTVLSALLSVGSVALELGAVLTVFVPITRWPIVVSAAGLHLGIWLTMWPNYFPQTFCYLLGVYWPVPDKWSVVAHTLPHMDASGTALFVAWMSVALCGVLTVIALLKLEYWPFTGIPMYSFYRDASYDYKWLRDATQAQAVAVEHVYSYYPNAIAWSNLWVVLRLKNKNAPPKGAPPTTLGTKGEARFVNLRNRICNANAKHGVYNKQLRRILHNVAAADMAAKPEGRIEYDPAQPRTPAQRWLRHVLPVLRQYAHEWGLPDWAEESGELQLRVKLRDGYCILGRVDWNALLPLKKLNASSSSPSSSSSSSAPSVSTSASSSAPAVSSKKKSKKDD